MGKDGFYYQLDDDFRGTRVRVQTTEHSYEGWTRLWHFDQHAVLLYDATRDDGLCGAVHRPSIPVVAVSENRIGALSVPLTG